MQKTIVRAYSVEITDEDIVRMREFWRQTRENALGGSRYLDAHISGLSEAEIANVNADIQLLVDLTDNGTRSFEEWLYLGYEAATYCIDGGDHSGALYWSAKQGGWVESDSLRNEQGEIESEYDFGPIFYLYHGHDLDVEAEHEDAYFDSFKEVSA